jgi:hypothetical protein
MRGSRTELTEGLRRFFLGASFVVASFLLYLGVAMWLLTPGGYHESLLEQAIPALFILFAGILICGIAWLLRRAESVEPKLRSRRLTLPLTLGIVLMGSVLISLAVFREHWLQVLWER